MNLSVICYEIFKSTACHGVMVPRCFLFGMHLQDTIWGARVSGGTVDQAAQYPQMIAYHLFCLLAKVGAKAIKMVWH